jgi:hypothetical protein
LALELPWERLSHVGNQVGSSVSRSLAIYLEPTMSDAILDEVRAIRQAHAAAFHVDLDAIYARLRKLVCESLTSN